jgi:hypothetical protein
MSDRLSLCLSDNLIYVAFISLVEIFNFEFLIGRQHNFGSFWHICQTFETQRLKTLCICVCGPLCHRPQWDHVFKVLILDPLLLATL